MAPLCDICGHECPQLGQSCDSISELPNCIAKGGFRLRLCDSCRAASSSEHARKAKLEISLHARMRFQERCSRIKSRSRCCEYRIRQMFRDSLPIVFSDHYMRERWMSGGDAEYFLSGEYLLVVTSAIPHTLMTIEPIGKKILGLDYWFLIEDNRNCLCV
jgi:hypothetical protein